jgi:hypothetical protein
MNDFGAKWSAPSSEDEDGLNVSKAARECMRGKRCFEQSLPAGG